MHHEVAPLTARLRISSFYSPLNKVHYIYQFFSHVLLQFSRVFLNSGSYALSLFYYTGKLQFHKVLKKSVTLSPCTLLVSVVGADRSFVSNSWSMLEVSHTARPVQRDYGRTGDRKVACSKQLAGVCLYFTPYYTNHWLPVCELVVISSPNRFFTSNIINLILSSPRSNETNSSFRFNTCFFIICNTNTKFYCNL